MFKTFVSLLSRYASYLLINSDYLLPNSHSWTLHHLHSLHSTMLLLNLTQCRHKLEPNWTVCVCVCVCVRERERKVKHGYKEKEKYIWAATDELQKNTRNRIWKITCILFSLKFCSYITLSKKSYQFKYALLIKIKVWDIIYTNTPFIISSRHV